MRWNSSTALAVALFFIQEASAASLGERFEDVVAHHGAAAATLNGGNRLIYRWQDWELTVDFVQGIAERMRYVKTTEVGTTDTDGIFTANGGIQAWQLQSGPPWQWMRNDGARLSQTAPDTVLLESASLARPEATPAPRPVVPVVVATPSLTEPAINPSQTQMSPPVSNLAKGFAAIFLFGLISVATRISPERLRRALTSALKPQQNRNVPNGASLALLPVSQKRGIADLDWNEFELLISELYRRRGFEVEIAAGTGPDDGVDVVLKKDAQRVLVQCKHWKAWKVGVKELREFFGVLVSETATRGIFVTSKSFTREALEFANGKPIELITGGELRAMLEESELIQNGCLLNFDEWIPGLVKHATIPVPSCPNCGTTMNRKKSRNGMFWGCSRFPKCYGKRNARRHLDL